MNRNDTAKPQRNRRLTYSLRRFHDIRLAQKVSAEQRIEARNPSAIDGTQKGNDAPIIMQPVKALPTKIRNNVRKQPDANCGGAKRRSTLPSAKREQPTTQTTSACKCRTNHEAKRSMKQRTHFTPPTNEWKDYGDDIDLM